MEKIDIISFLQSPDFLTRRLAGRTRFDVNNKITYNRAVTDNRKLEKSLNSSKNNEKYKPEPTEKPKNLISINPSKPDLCLLSNGTTTKLLNLKTPDQYIILNHTSRADTVLLNLTQEEENDGDEEVACMVFILQQNLLSFYMVSLACFDSLCENREENLEENSVLEHRFENKISQLSVSKFYPARIFFVDENKKAGFIDFEHSEPELTVLSTDSSSVYPCLQNPFNYYSVCSKSHDLRMEDTRVNKYANKSTFLSKSLSRIGSFCQLKLDKQKLAVSDQARIDLFDVRCPGRRLFAWECNTFGKYEDKFSNYDTLLSAPVSENTWENKNIYKFDGCEVIVGANLDTGKINGYPVNHACVDVFGQVTNHRDGRLDPSDPLQIDTVNDYLFSSHPDSKIGIQPDWMADVPKLSGIAVSGSKIVSLYDEIMLIQETKSQNEEDHENPVKVFESFGFTTKEAAVFDQLSRRDAGASHNESNKFIFQTEPKNQLFISSSDEEETDTEDERIINECWARYEKSKTSVLDEPELMPESRRITEKVQVDLLPGVTNENELETNYHSRLASLWETFQEIRLSDKEIKLKVDDDKII